MSRASPPRQRRLATAIARRLLATAGLAWLSLASIPAARAAGDENGWTYLIDKLAADGVDRRRAAAAFRDPRVGEFDELQFSLWPRESAAMYKGFLGSSSVAGARRCRGLYASELSAAEERFGVPASLVAAIIHVESHCGRVTGDEVVLYRLARLAMANEPANLRRNIYRHSHGVSPSRRDEIEARTRERARYLENTFYPEVLATFQIADRLGIDPLGIRGSQAGAFGLPQFLPSSYVRFGVDGNDDGRVSLFDPADAIASCAKYLAAHGWRLGLSRSQQRDVIWSYNRSPAYIDTVLALAARLQKTPN